VDPDQLLTAMAVSTLPCILFDHGVHAIQEWQRRRAGIVEVSGFGPLGRTVVSLAINGAASALIAFVYRSIGREQQDAFLIGASIWLMITVPVLFTSRYIDESQQKILATRILGWLFKTAIAAGSAAYFITIAP
jgi:hypothetical protein